MGLLLIRTGCGLGLAVALLLSACAVSEQKAARRLDMTHDAIEQASNLFASDPELSRFSIAVDGFKGAMRLKGQVQTDTQKIRAEKMLWAVRGVRSVQNDLEVRVADRK